MAQKESLDIKHRFGKAIRRRRRELDLSQEINENTLVDLDKQGNICAITLEHTKSLTDMNAFSLETIVAPQLASS